MRAETRHLCITDWRRITRLAEALRVTPVIDGERAIEIMRGKPTTKSGTDPEMTEDEAREYAEGGWLPEPGGRAA